MSGKSRHQQQRFCFVVATGQMTVRRQLPKWADFVVKVGFDLSDDGVSVFAGRQSALSEHSLPEEWRFCVLRTFTCTIYTMHSGPRR